MIILRSNTKIFVFSGMLLNVGPPNVARQWTNQATPKPTPPDGAAAAKDAAHECFFAAQREKRMTQAVADEYIHLYNEFILAYAPATGELFVLIE